MHTHFTCLSCGKTITMKEPLPMSPDLCDLCSFDAKARAKEDAAKALRQHRMENFLTNCPKNYATSDEARFPQNEWKTIREWSPASGRGILIKGVTGKCKTRMLWTLARKLTIAGQWVESVNDAELADEIAQAWDTRGEYGRVMRRYLGCDVLILDDIGKAKATERMAATYYRLVEDRTSQGRPILATTNMHGDRLSKNFNDETGAIVRRLREFCDQILIQ